MRKTLEKLKKKKERNYKACVEPLAFDRIGDFSFIVIETQTTRWLQMNLE